MRLADIGLIPVCTGMRLAETLVSFPVCTGMRLAETLVSFPVYIGLPSIVVVIPLCHLCSVCCIIGGHIELRKGICRHSARDEGRKVLHCRWSCREPERGEGGRRGREEEEEEEKEEEEER